jgi:Flp pilus assembly protein TadG
MLVRQRQRRPRQGTTIVEAAAVIVIFFSFLFSIVEYGRYVALRQVAENAARNGARWAVCNINYNSDNGLAAGDKTKPIQVVRDAMGNGQAGSGTSNNMVEKQLQSPVIDVYKINPSTGANLGAWDTANSGEYLAVEITGQFKFVVPNFLQMTSGILNIRTRVVMRIE